MSIFMLIERYAQPYDKDVETLVEEEDQQPLSEPIIAPLKHKILQSQDVELPRTTYSKEFLRELQAVPSRIRNVAIVGNLHAGKTCFMDLLLMSSHPDYEWHAAKGDMDTNLKFTDTLRLEQARHCSVQPTPVTFLAQTSKGTSYVVTAIDTPGHVDFQDQVVASLALVDGIVLLVDVIEGLMCGTEAVLRLAHSQGLAMTLVLNKMDRLITEVKLPPIDAYYKLKHVLDEVNTFLSALGSSHRFAPELGNVVFADCQAGWVFSLAAFGNYYGQQFDVDGPALAKRLWGDVFYDVQRRTFGLSSCGGKHKRSFVHFVLDPLYKLYGQVLGEDKAVLQHTLASLDIHLKAWQYGLNVKPLLRLVLGRFFGEPDRGIASVLDMLVKHVPSPRDAVAPRLALLYKGDLASPLAKCLASADLDGPLMVRVSKCYPCNAMQDEANPEAAIAFDVLGRVFSGRIAAGMTIQVLGEDYSPEEREDARPAEVQQLLVPCGRYKLDLGDAFIGPGNIVLLRGVDATIVKTATITTTADYEDLGGAAAAGGGGALDLFRPLVFPHAPLLKLAIEPFVPASLPTLVAGLRALAKCHPLFKTAVEESGEHVLFAVGELGLDCMLHDLRSFYAEGVDLRTADPVVQFNETCDEMSSLPCFASSPNGRNTLTMIAQPIGRPLATDIETGRLAQLEPLVRAQHIVHQYGGDAEDWDLLAARSIWAFGPRSATQHGCSLLCNDTLSWEVDRTALAAVKDHVTQGFQWAVREGPLCDEPIRQVRFRLTNAVLSSEPVHRGGGQLIPTARRVVYAALLTASPRLMEPMYRVQVLSPSGCISAVYALFSRRRGHVLTDVAMPATPLHRLEGLLPIMDSFGFETDLRTHTFGQAFCQAVFDHWQIVPGDPLDSSVPIMPLEPAPAPQLARDFLLKTRRRKGLPDDPSIQKFLDDAMKLALDTHEQDTMQL